LCVPQWHYEDHARVAPHHMVEETVWRERKGERRRGKVAEGERRGEREREGERGRGKVAEREERRKREREREGEG